MAEHRTGEYLNVCRLCLCGRTDSLKSIFDVALGPNRLPQKIQQLVAIQVNRQDKFSTLICNDCIIRLDTFHAYKRECHRNQTKLAEWLNNADGSTQHEPILQIKPDPYLYEGNDMATMNGNHSMWPIKVEIAEPMDEEYNDLPPHLTPHSYDSNSEPFLYNSPVQPEDERRCPECGRLFASYQNMKRHQNMVHRKDKRTPMNEIKKSLSEPAEGEDGQDDEAENGDKDEEENDDIMEESSVQLTENHGEVDFLDEDNTEKDKSLEEGHDDDKPPELETNSVDPLSENVLEEGNESDQQKIQFAAGLKLVQKDSTPIECQALSKIELSYIEKCKAMVSMFHTLQCACHNVQHKTVRNLLSHLRELRIWFPLFTCYSCMISFTDRSTFTKHYTKCPKNQLETLIKLSNLKKRSEMKTRLYQNYKCNRCRFLYSFYDDYCKHIEEEHAAGEPPFYCSCRFVFDTLEEYKSHCYNSCVLSYYCDICFITTANLDEFVKHCQEQHDQSEGFVLLQEDGYSPRKSFQPKEADEEVNLVEGKRERRRSIKPPVFDDMFDDEVDKEVPPDPKNIPAKIIATKILNMDGLKTAADWRNPASCPTCLKDYSSVHNMVRHYKTHIERNEVVIPPHVLKECHTAENSTLYSCPDCGGMYNSVDWTQHLEESHPSMPCEDCDEVFKFQSELEQHRTDQHQEKGYGDVEAHPYRRRLLNPGPKIENITDGVMVMCDLCDTMFKTKEDLKSHKLLYHQPSSNMSQSGSSVNGDGFEAEEDDDNMPILDNEEEEEEDVKSEFMDKYVCDQCDRVYASVKTLKEHMKNKHGTLYVQKNEFPKKCDYCDKMCTTGSALYLHTQMHERMTLSDLREDKTAIGKARKKSELEETFETEEESYHMCKYCFKVFGTKGRLLHHMKCHGVSTIKRTRKHLCDLCHTSLDSKEELEKHKAEEHADELDDMPQLVNQMEVEVEIKQEVEEPKFEIPKIKPPPVLCKHCLLTFTSVGDLTKHMREEHSPKPRVVKEKRKDSVEKNVKCPLCKKAFASVGAMTAHAGWHKRAGSRLENPEANSPQAIAALKLARQSRVFKKAPPPKPQPPKFQCTTCFAQLPNDTALQIHILEKHRNVAEVMLVPRCNTCNKDFASQAEYETHKRFHEFLERQKKHGNPSPPVKKNPCNYCSSRFTRTDTLAAHIRQHHPEHVKTEFRCNQCDRVFEKQNSLTIHLKVHEKQKNGGVVVGGGGGGGGGVGGGGGAPSAKVYLCPICNMTFNFTKDLRMHTIKAHPF